MCVSHDEFVVGTSLLVDIQPHLFWCGNGESKGALYFGEFPFIRSRNASYSLSSNPEKISLSSGITAVKSIPSLNLLWEHTLATSVHFGYESLICCEGVIPGSTLNKPVANSIKKRASAHSFQTWKFRIPLSTGKILTTKRDTLRAAQCGSVALIHWRNFLDPNIRTGISYHSHPFIVDFCYRRMMCQAKMAASWMALWKL